MALARWGRQAFAPFAATAAWYDRTAKAHPLSTAIITTGLKTTAADLFAQKIVEGRKEVDWTRNTAFTLFGFAYLGGFQYWLYNVKFAELCGPLAARVGHTAVAPIKTLLDQGVHHPLLYFPTFFSLKTVVEGKPLSSAVTKYKEEIWESCLALWKIWVPAQIINFAFVPRHLRIPFVALVSFGWTVVFSLMQGRSLTAKQLEGALDCQDIYLDNLPKTAPERTLALAEKLAGAKDAAPLGIPPWPSGRQSLPVPNMQRPRARATPKLATFKHRWVLAVLLSIVLRLDGWRTCSNPHIALKSRSYNGCSLGSKSDILLDFGP
eukprot:jgi/Botrbrau1/23076/Bobra.0243s0017.1